MELFEGIETRRSVRSFSEESVSEAAIDRILMAGQWAPSAGNLQARSFIVVRSAEQRHALARASRQRFVETAPVIIAVAADHRRSEREYGRRGRTLYAIQDATAAVENILLAAHGLGFGACWVGAFDEDHVHRALETPDHITVVAIVPVGRPAEEPPPPDRRPLESVAHEERWGTTYEPIEDRRL